jgi:homoserine dehydrogenase
MTVDIVLVGFGHVAQRFVALLDEQRARIAGAFGFDGRVIAVCTQRHGCIFSDRGLDTAALVERRRRGESVGPAGGSRLEMPTVDFIRDVARRSASAQESRLVVVETTTLDIAHGQPAIDHVRTALQCGAHVVTANKGPAAFAYHSIAAAATAAGRRFLFEGAVMDGIPIFNLARETLPAVEVVGFRGIVNTTTNYMLTAIEQGQAFDAALSEMRAAGIAEADASLDIDGWDAAAKTAALANVLLSARITPHEVVREGISASTGPRAVSARAAGRRLKLVASAARDEHGVTVRVGLQELAADDLLAGIAGQQNAIILKTDLLGELAIVQRGSGLTQTAYALLSDLISIARDFSARPDGRRARV